MKTTIIAIAALIMVSCKKETPQPECNCNEVHLRNTGSGAWEIQSTTPIDTECWRHNEVTDEWQTTPSWSPFPWYHKKVIICE